MALAYATYGSNLRSNATLAADIQTGLNWMYANRYNETATEYDNWYDWEIGAPLSIADVAIFMYDARRRILDALLPRSAQPLSVADDGICLHAGGQLAFPPAPRGGPLSGARLGPLPRERPPVRPGPWAGRGIP
jgi:hypothetical protein